MSVGMPQIPSGGGIITAPIVNWPSPRMSIKPLRSRLNAIARRRSGLSNGGALRLITIVLLTLFGRSSQIACGT